MPDLVEWQIRQTETGATLASGTAPRVGDKWSAGTLTLPLDLDNGSPWGVRHRALPEGRTPGPWTWSPRRMTDSIVRLYHPEFTTKIHPKAPLHDNSVNIAAALVAQFESEPFVNGAPKPGAGPIDAIAGGVYRTRISTGEYSIPSYRMPLDWPRTKVAQTSKEGAMRTKWITVNGVRRYFQEDLDKNGGVPLPNPADLPDGLIQPEGTDGSVIITCGHELWEMFVFRALDPARSADAAALAEGYTFRCAQGGYIADTRYHPGWWASSRNESNPKGGDYGVGAPGCAYSGFTLTADDYNAPDILHPLSLSLYITGGEDALADDPGSVARPDYFLPATRYDKYNYSRSSDLAVNRFRIPEGVRFRLPPEKWTDEYLNAYAAAKGRPQTDGYGATAPELAKFLRCLRDFGMVITDTAANILGLSAEHNKTFGTQYNKAEKKPNWGDPMLQFPWRDFVVVAPHPVQIAVPGEGPTSPQPAPFDFSRAPAA